MGVTFGKGNGHGNGHGHGLPPKVPEEKLIKAAIHLAKDMVETVGVMHEIGPTLFCPDMTALEPVINAVGLGYVPREHMGAAAIKALQRFKAPWYVYITEAWASREAPQPGKMVKDVEGREEMILLILVRNHKGVVSWDTRKVTRAGDERSLGPWMSGKEFKAISRMFPMDW